MIKMKKKQKYLKYFIIPLEDARNWDWKDYTLFVVETLWTTVFPFISGMLLVARKQIIWIFMLILPIYFKIYIEKKIHENRRNKKIFVK